MKPNAQTISIPHPEKPGQSFNGYLVKPARLPAPAMLILHETYGLNQNMRDMAQRFADAGYVALAADLFSDGNKIVCMFRAFYGLLVSPLNNGTARNVRAAFEFLQKLDGVDAKRVGAMGFCLGGSYALQLACLDGDPARGSGQVVRAISIVSGMNPRPIEAAARACPIVGSWAENDFATGDGKKLDVVLDEYKIPHEIKIYAGGIHSMFKDDAKNYDADIATDAWKRTLAFFETYMTPTDNENG